MYDEDDGSIWIRIAVTNLEESLRWPAAENKRSIGDGTQRRHDDAVGLQPVLDGHVDALLLPGVRPPISCFDVEEEGADDRLCVSWNDGGAER